MTRIVFVALLASACMTTAAHEKTIAELGALRMEHEQAAAKREHEVRAKLPAAETELAQLKHDLEQTTRARPT